MKVLALFMLITALAACSNEPERAYTVDEFLANKSLLAEVIAKCRNNPGELGNTPNCQNAAAADFKARLERMGQALGG
ncbi:EexN family lipoprotein [Ensifer sp. BR816]|jgi:hypothetical protein|uniref:EexN family lipoprotein n=1 Tax=Rhizobium sp. (strain BR816) TaxID=1057002 RepID=UPI000373B033|nr:EexN family lipoprotein [Ensifer sp. BR816]